MHHSTAAELAESAGRFADARAVPGLCGQVVFNFFKRGVFCFVCVLFRDGPCPPRWRARPIEEPRHKPLGGGGGGSGISSGGSSSSSRFFLHPRILPHATSATPRRQICRAGSRTPPRQPRVGKRRRMAPEKVPARSADVSVRRFSNI